MNLKDTIPDFMKYKDNVETFDKGITRVAEEPRFTTSMNRKVCWENGYKKGKEEARKEFIEMVEDKKPKFCVYCGNKYRTCNCLPDKTLDYVVFILEELKQQLSKKTEEEKV